MKNEKQLVSKAPWKLVKQLIEERELRVQRFYVHNLRSICIAAYVKRLCFRKLSITHKVCFVKVTGTI